MEIEHYDLQGFAGIFVQMKEHDGRLFYAEIQDVRWEKDYIVLAKPQVYLGESKGFSFFTLEHIDNIVVKGILLMHSEISTITFTDNSKKMLNDLSGGIIKNE